MSTRKRIPIVAARALLISTIAVLTVLAYQLSLQSPPNVLWAIFSGDYQYDPRRETPPPDLFRDRPEASLAYFLNATLQRCGGTYPPLSHAVVTRYEIGS